jgi:hypothetical protein
MLFLKTKGELFMIPCEQFKQKILDFYDGELDVLQKKIVEQHLKGCLKCSRFLNRIRTMRSYLKKLTPVNTPESFYVLLRERIRRELAGRRMSNNILFFPSWRWIPVFGCFLFLIFAGFLMLDMNTWNHPMRQIQMSQVFSPESSDRNNDDSKMHYVIDDLSGSNLDMYSEKDVDIAEQDTILNLEKVNIKLTPVYF